MKIPLTGLPFRWRRGCSSPTHAATIVQHRSLSSPALSARATTVCRRLGLYRIYSSRSPPATFDCTSRSVGRWSKRSRVATPSAQKSPVSVLVIDEAQQCATTFGDLSVQLHDVTPRTGAVLVGLTWPAPRHGRARRSPAPFATRLGRTTLHPPSDSPAASSLRCCPVPECAADVSPSQPAIRRDAPVNAEHLQHAMRSCAYEPP